MPTLYDPTAFSQGMVAGAQARRLQVEADQQALANQQAQKVAQAQNLYNQYAYSPGVTNSDLQQMYQDQGLGLQGQQVMNQVQQAQMQNPVMQLKRQQLSNAAIMAVTAPTDDEFQSTKQALFRQAQAQGLDLSGFGINSAADVDKLSRADMASFIMDPKVVEEIGKQRMELLGGAASPDQKLARQALIARGNPNPTASDIQNELIRVDQQKNKAKFAALGDTKLTSAFDLATGKMVKNSATEQSSEPGRYLDPGDPDVVALKKQQEYSAGISRFTNRLETLGQTILDTINKYGLNTGSKIGNMTVQDLIDRKLLGKGEIIALKNQVAGFSAELGKTESGSLGISGATKDALDKFDIPYTLPVADMVKVIQGARDAGKSVTDAMDQSKQQIVNNIYAGTKYEGNLPRQLQTRTAPATPAPAAAVMTATNPKTGQKIKSLDGGKTWQAM